MRHFSLSAITVVLALCGSVVSQQRLAVHNDQNDPCHRFKMRILVPADVVDRKLPMKSFAGGLDSGILWDPCSEHGPEIAFVISGPGLNRKNLGLAMQPLSFQREFGKNAPKMPSEFLLLPLRSTFLPKSRQP